MKPKRIKRYYILRIFSVAVLFYYFLTLPLLGFIWFKQAPELFEKQQNAISQLKKPNESANTPAQQKTIIDSVSVFNNNLTFELHSNPSNENQPSENRTGDTFTLSFKLLTIGALLFFALNLPFRNYLKRKRKQKPISEKQERFVKKYITWVPGTSAALLLFIFTLLHVYMGFQIHTFAFTDEIGRELYTQYFYLSLAASLLSCFFIFLWQRHRVHLLYLDCIYSEEELRVSVFKRTGGSISRRLSIVSLVTVIIPLAIMSMYLYLGISKISDLGPLSAEKIAVLMGPYSKMPGMMDALGDAKTLSGLFYINALDQIVMFLGIFTGMVIAILFLFFIVKWNAQYVVTPINDLVEKMRLTGRGELHSYCHVKTNDEIGELAQGYNDMSAKLAHYIQYLMALSEANSRFVPTALLHALGKEKITEVELGDQIQKEMTVLFSDIRSFTSLSEKMTPKETFDFINHYLGLMEPVIRNNHGFIDKYIGDAIMALFDEPRDACNAAREMQTHLEIFNAERRHEGKLPIQIGIGINTGKLMLGIVGGAGRISGTVISDAVNAASRLEELTKYYKTPCIIAENTWRLLSPALKANCRFLDIAEIRGKKETLKLFELFTNENQERLRFIQQAQPSFDSAIRLYLNRKFAEAEEIFAFLAQEYPNDPVMPLYLERCRKYQQTDIPENWDGVAIK
ncbi:MAG: adenylate/guanylate cyclase domain-containing protein [Bacteroidales bacterium]|nr:adenylate/guanylate cyclase domain-containing protein [Bacteroidales bacterium]MDD2322912.1 adenylate/guanylate cyclase domain-containing protein [Bacteroidales bacterium]MDD3010224.1 adenylate/guanylate cyclase domain-containing protein [Bacteroidales bacterium]MDD3962419.1 adenylate/guanylate cyclase domain-containing protein [Bacteroidales bacterium]MDY0285826.1 adenylate/guanylate cyclase domain-containing protein [Bacteroidales bacterium]